MDGIITPCALLRINNGTVLSALDILVHFIMYTIIAAYVVHYYISSLNRVRNNDALYSALYGPYYLCSALYERVVNDSDHCFLYKCTS